MSWAEDEGYDGYDLSDIYEEWHYCDKCDSEYPPHQPFCYKCLSVENKWRLGVL